MGLKRTHMTALAAATVLAFTSACISDSGTPRDEETEFAYPDSMFDWRSEETEWCQGMPSQIPDNGFIDSNRDFDNHGDDLTCSVDQVEASWERTVIRYLSAQWSNGVHSSEEIYASTVGEAEVVELPGLGDKAALVPTAAIHTRNASRVDYLMSLVVLEKNLVLEFQAGSDSDLDGPNLRNADLVLTAETLIGTAEATLEDLGAENYELQSPEPQPQSGITELPDLCTALDLDGLALAADQDDWAAPDPLIDNCHWKGEGTDFWLSAEAVGPLDAAGITAEEFASWWLRSVPAAGGEPYGLLDESYLLTLDADPRQYDDIEQPAADFVLRIGNVILQGRYQDGSPAPLPAAADYVTALAEQTQALLASAES